MSVKKQIIDQGSHAATAYVTCLIVDLLSPETSGMAFIFIGFMLGFMRELTEEGVSVKASHLISVFTDEGNLIDLAGWTFGGFVGYILL